MYDYYTAPVELSPDELAASLFDLPAAPEADPYAYYDDDAPAESEMAANTNAILNIAAGDIAKYPNVAASKLPGKVDVPEAAVAAAMSSWSPSSNPDAKKAKKASSLPPAAKDPSVDREGKIGVGFNEPMYVPDFIDHENDKSESGRRL